jgi:hypothetical protein
MCSPMARASARLPNPVEMVEPNPLISVEHIWYLVTKTAALHGRIGPHNIWHNICVRARSSMGEIGCHNSRLAGPGSKLPYRVPPFAA